MLPIRIKIDLKKERNKEKLSCILNFNSILIHSSGHSTKHFVDLTSHHVSSIKPIKLSLSFYQSSNSKTLHYDYDCLWDPFPPPPPPPPPLYITFSLMYPCGSKFQSFEDQRIKESKIDTDTQTAPSDPLYVQSSVSRVPCPVSRVPCPCISTHSTVSSVQRPAFLWLTIQILCVSRVSSTRRSSNLNSKPYLLTLVCRVQNVRCRTSDIGVAGPDFGLCGFTLCGVWPVAGGWYKGGVSLNTEYEYLWWWW